MQDYSISSALAVKCINPLIWVTFKLTLVIAGLGILYEITLSGLSLHLTDDKSTLVQIMAWCHLAPSHYLRQCLPWYLSPYGITRPQWAVFTKLHRHISFCCYQLLNGRWWGKMFWIKMYWTPAKMLLLANVDEYNFANAEWVNLNSVSWIIIGFW